MQSYTNVRLQYTKVKVYFHGMTNINTKDGKIHITIDISQVMGSKTYTLAEACDYLGIQRAAFTARRKKAQVKSAGRKGLYTQADIDKIIATK